MPDSYKISPTTRVKRLAKRGAYDAETVHAILDEALVCHVAVQVEGRPRVLPTLHWRIGDRLFIHGNRKNGLFQAMRAGAEAAVAVTLMDGLVLARSAFHHSVNYRSVMAVGRFAEVTDRQEELSALEAMMEKLKPGRWAEVRLPTEVEMAQTTVMAMTLDEVSAKLRSGPPIDEDADYALPVWAGVVPLALVHGAPIRDEKTAP